MFQQFICGSVQQNLYELKENIQIPFKIVLISHIIYKTFAIISYVNWEHISGFVDLQPILLTNAIPPTDHLFNIFFFWGGGRVRGLLLRHAYYTGKGQCHKVFTPNFFISIN